MPRFSLYEEMYSTDYPRLREVLAPQYRNLPTEDIEALFANYNLSAGGIEEFLDVGKTISHAAPVVLPVAGTVAGSALGGPVGGAVGGYAGQYAGKEIGRATTHRSKSRYSPRKGKQKPAQTPPGTSAAAAQLMQIMCRPEMLQALMSMALGQLGRPNVKVNQNRVPVDAFTNLLATLAHQAQMEHQAANPSLGESMPEYLRDYAGEVTIDPSVSEQRAAILYEMLIESDVEPANAQWKSTSQSMMDIESEADEESFYAELEFEEIFEQDDQY